MTTYSVYRILNERNGKSYIGYTGRNLIRYVNGHFSSAERGACPSKVFYNAIRKYGRESFQIILLAAVETADRAQVLEIENISKFKTRTHQHGYNMTEGGDGGDTSASPQYQIGMKNRKTVSGPDHHHWGGVSDKARARMSAAKKGKKPANLAAFTNAATGKILVHQENDPKEYRIDPSDLESYLAQGFKRGRPLKQCPVCLKWANRVTLLRHHRH